jgi:hypothetical protein
MHWYFHAAIQHFLARNPVSGFARQLRICLFPSQLTGGFHFAVQIIRVYNSKLLRV